MLDEEPGMRAARMVQVHMRYQDVFQAGSPVLPQALPGAPQVLGGDAGGARVHRRAEPPLRIRYPLITGRPPRSPGQ
ncbi:MAG: hypothetical protein ACP5ID_03725 [Conexivisphaera sp.]